MPVKTMPALAGRRSDGSRRVTRAARARRGRGAGPASRGHAAPPARGAAARRLRRNAWRWPRAIDTAPSTPVTWIVARLEGVDQRQRLQQVGARRARDHVAGAERVGDVGHVAVAEAAPARLRSRERDREARPAGQARGRAAEHRAGGLRDGQRREEREDRAARRLVDGGLVGDVGGTGALGAGVEVGRLHAHRHGRRQRAHAARRRRSARRCVSVPTSCPAAAYL